MVAVADSSEHAAMRSLLGKGLCPNPSRCGQDVAGDPNGLDDGEPPAVAFPAARPPTSAAVIEAELEMCTALAHGSLGIHPARRCFEQWSVHKKPKRGRSTIQT